MDIVEIHWEYNGSSSMEDQVHAYYEPLRLICDTWQMTVASCSCHPPGFACALAVTLLPQIGKSKGPGRRTVVLITSWAPRFSGKPTYPTLRSYPQPKQMQKCMIC